MTGPQSPLNLLYMLQFKRSLIPQVINDLIRIEVGESTFECGMRHD